MTDRDIMQQALEALELLSRKPTETALDYADNAIDALRLRLAQPEQEEKLSTAGYVKKIESLIAERDALRERLAQPEQEPVAWWNDTGTHIDLNVSGRGTPLYTAPPPRKKLPPQTPCLLTQAENKMFRFGWLECEAAHGIKENT